MGRRGTASAHVRTALAVAGYAGSSGPSPSVMPVMASLAAAQATAIAQVTVVIWQAAGGIGHDKTFMYRPVMDTLVDGFANPPAAVVAAIGRPNVLSGSGTSNKDTRMVGLAKGLGARDIFLFIGPIGTERVPWQAMRKHGVRTIYYQTEPVNGCALSTSKPDEVWDFSWHNLEACKPWPTPYAMPWLDGKPLQMRYVPMGYVKPPNEPRRLGHAPREGTKELLFFGYPFYKSGRKKCYLRLQSVLGDRLNATWMVWSDADFARWWKGSGRWAAHVNLHKGCENARNPVVFRTSLLLSRGATVISEHSDPKDEAEYAGLVHFAKVDEIPGTLDRQWIPPQPPTPFGLERMRSLQLRADIARQYSQRFAPQRIFERAGV